MAAMSQGGGGWAELEVHCPVCYSCNGTDKFSTLVCGHVLHEACLELALQHKKECPVCRCPAKPARSNGGSGSKDKVKCPCVTGQPLKLYNLQLKANMAPSPLPRGGGSATPQHAPASHADTVAAQQRAERLRAALEEERTKVVKLELELEQQAAEIQRALDKAERRKQRLANCEREHRDATARLQDDKAQLLRDKDKLEKDLAAAGRTAHALRMDLAKAHEQLRVADLAVFNLRREAALARSRAGGAAAPGAQELVALLGDSKEDWAVFYSVKVDELRAAQAALEAARQEAARDAAQADARVTTERLAGAERAKAVERERDDAKRELNNAECELFEAQRQLQELREQLQQQLHQPLSARAAVTPFGGGLGGFGGTQPWPSASQPRPVATRATQPQPQSQPLPTQPPPAGPPHAAARAGGGARGGVGPAEPPAARAAAAAAGAARAAEASPAGASSDGLAEEGDDDDDSEWRGLQAACPDLEEEVEGDEADGAEGPHEHERQALLGPLQVEVHALGDAGASPFTERTGGARGLGVRAVDVYGVAAAAAPASSSYSVGGGAGARSLAGAAPAAASAGGLRAPPPSNGGQRTIAPTGPFGGSGSFISMAAAAGAHGPLGDERSGTSRFPLTSSFAHNASKVSSLRVSAAGKAGRGRGKESVPAAGRMEAFLLRPAQPKNLR